VSGKGIREIQALKSVYSRFRSIFVLLGLLSLCLTTYLCLKAISGQLTPFDILIVGLLALACIALCIAQVRCLRTLSSEAARRIETLALFDDLTGVYNYRYMQYRLKEELTRSKRHKRPLSVVFVDLDRFKDVNDQHGHREGDEVIKQVAQLLRSKTRSDDLFGRLGGDEFFAILPETNIKEAITIAERLCQSLRSFSHKTPDGRTIHNIRLSAGVASYPDVASDIDALLVAADRAMYGSKRNGGDQFTVATPLEHVAGEHSS